MKQAIPHRFTARLAAVAGTCALMMCLASPAAYAADMKVAAKAVKVAAPAEAPLVKVDAAWIRPTVTGQTATGGFMNLTASQALTLTGFSTTVAASSELHEMVMDGSVMRMRAVPALALPAGQTVSLRPGAGGQHLMLMELKQPLKEGEELTLSLKLRTADGKEITQDVKVPVKIMAMPMGQGMGPGMGAASGASGTHPGMPQHMMPH